MTQEDGHRAGLSSGDSGFRQLKKAGTAILLDPSVSTEEVPGLGWDKVS